MTVTSPKAPLPNTPCEPVVWLIFPPIPEWLEHAYPTLPEAAFGKIIKSTNDPAVPSTPTGTCMYFDKSKLFNGSPAPWKYRGCELLLPSDRSKRYVLPAIKFNVGLVTPSITNSYGVDAPSPITVTVNVCVAVL